MPIREQARRMMIMQDTISEKNIDYWLKEFMDDLDAVQNENKQLDTNVLSFEEKNGVLEKYKQSQKRLILLDYDGTLTDFALIPEQAFPSTRIMSLLKSLSDVRNNKLCIISGRKAEDLQKWFGHLQIILIAEHGCTYKLPSGEEWFQMSNMDLSWKAKVKGILEKMVVRYPGSFVEDKIYSLAWHYRVLQNKIDDTVFIDLNKKLSSINTANAFKVLQGNKVVEIKSSSMNKGLAALKLLSSDAFDFVLAMGDDATDEDMFDALNEEAHITIKVGLNKSKAKFNIIGITNVISFLDQLAFLN